MKKRKIEENEGEGKTGNTKNDQGGPVWDSVVQVRPGRRSRGPTGERGKGAGRRGEKREGRWWGMVVVRMYDL